MNYANVETIHKARKNHTCDNCGWLIKSGFRYARVVRFPTEDHPIESFFICMDCYYDN